MAANNQIEVTIVGGYLEIKNITNPNASIESYDLSKVTSINEYYQNYTAINAYQNGRHEYDEEFSVLIDLEENPESLIKIEFDIQNVTNQAGWTADRAGLAQAVSDIRAAVGAVFGGGGSTAPAPYTTFDTGNKLVATAGTAEALVGVATPTSLVVITALANNTDTIVVGDSGVIAAIGTRSGTPLEPGDSVDVAIDDVQKIFIDSVVSGEGVSFTHYN